jgi:methionine sulfoxide reductase heme-binding subunit
MALSQPDKKQLAAIKLAVFLLALIPIAQLAWGVYADSLGPNPIETITRKTGSWTFNFLLITLTVTPLRKLSEWHWLLRLRRMLGLFCFFYACLHFMTFVWFDHFFDWQAIAKDVVKRPFVTAGFAAFVLLIPLAATSNNWAIRQLGGKRWQALHRTVYATGIIACVHYFWLVKPIALLYPLSYALILAVLLGFRVRLRKAAYGPYLTPGAAARPGNTAAKTVKFYPSRPQ